MEAVEHRFFLPRMQCHIAAKIHGHEQDTPAIALHGWLDNAATFDRLAPCLKDLRFIAVDLPGHGHSGHLPLGRLYHFLDTIYFLSELFEVLGGGPFLLIGHSLGAGIAALFAATFPEKVTKLVLIEALGGLTTPTSEALARLRKSVHSFLELPAKKVPIYPTLADAIKARLRASPMSEEGARLLCQRGLRSVDNGFTWRTDQSLTLPSAMRFTEEQMLCFLQGITCPSLLIKGKAGMLQEPHAKAREACVKHLKVVELPGGHHLHLDDPAAVAQPINRFC